MDEKKIEPTDAMVDEAANAMCITATDTSLSFYSDPVKRTYRNRSRTVLRAALNHPDARGLFADVDVLRAANPHRPVQELPTTPRTVIVPADGHKYIEAVVSGVVWRTREAVLGLDGRWHGAWRVGSGRLAVESTSSDSITPGTWKVDEK